MTEDKNNERQGNNAQEQYTRAQNSKENSRKKGMKPLTMLITLAMIGCAFFFMPQILGLISSSGSNNESPAVTFGKKLSAKVIKDEVLKQDKLVTYTDSFEIVVDFSNNINIPWTEIMVPGTRRELSITLPVTVDLTTDLSMMDITYDEEDDTAHVTIPSAEVFRVTPDIAALDDQQHVGLFRRKMSAEEQQAFIVEAENKAESEINAHNLFELANSRAASILTGLIEQLGVKHVEVAVQ